MGLVEAFGEGGFFLVVAEVVGFVCGADEGEADEGIWVAGVGLQCAADACERGRAAA